MEITITRHYVMFEKHTDLEIRLQQWRAVRNNSNSEQDVLESFANIKVLARYLDYYTPESWYNPFDIIEYGYFCTTGISVLLYHTLESLGYIDTKLVEWKVISNHVTGYDGAVFVYDGHMYNLSPGKKVHISKVGDMCIELRRLGHIKLLNI